MAYYNSLIIFIYLSVLYSTTSLLNNQKWSIQSNQYQNQFKPCIRQSTLTSLNGFNKNTLPLPTSFNIDDTECVLNAVSTTNRGSNATPELNQLVAEWIHLKSNQFVMEKKLAKNDIHLLGNYEVTYVGSGNKLGYEVNKGNPAGGGFRGNIGQFLFRTDNLLQNIIQNELNQTQVVNIVKGKLLNLIPFRVILYGLATFLNDTERLNTIQKYGNPLTESVVKATFEPPLLCFGNEWHPRSFCLQIGPTSSVVLDTPYIDSRIRLGVGSRGSLFIFTRTFDMMANEWQIWRTQKKPISAKKVGKSLVISGLLLNSIGLLLRKYFWKLSWMTLTAINSKNIVSYLPGAGISLLGLFLWKNSGGIINDRLD